MCLLQSLPCRKCHPKGHSSVGFRNSRDAICPQVWTIGNVPWHDLLPCGPVSHITKQLLQNLQERPKGKRLGHLSCLLPLPSRAPPWILAIGRVKSINALSPFVYSIAPRGLPRPCLPPLPHPFCDRYDHLPSAHRPSHNMTGAEVSYESSPCLGLSARPELSAYKNTYLLLTEAREVGIMIGARQLVTRSRPQAKVELELILSQSVYHDPC